MFVCGWENFVSRHHVKWRPRHDELDDETTFGGGVRVRVGGGIKGGGRYKGINEGVDNSFGDGFGTYVGGGLEGDAEGGWGEWGGGGELRGD